MADGYIDDLITLAIDAEEWIWNSQNAAPLAVDTVFRSENKDDPLPRPPAASIKKLKAEGLPDETKIVLGWLINTRLFRIFLPIDKASFWIIDLKSILRKDKVNAKFLERNIGRLNHAGYILPTGRYFLNRLRHLLTRCHAYGTQSLNEHVREDLKLWIELLEIAYTKGVDINNLTFTKPTDVTFSDACETGMGGFDSEGFAWRYELPDELQRIFSINLLEFTAATITINLTIKKKRKT